MEPQYINLAFNGLFSLLLYFMKTQYEDLKEKIRKQDDELTKLRDNTMKKDDFREFKEELYVRLDELKLDLRQEVERLRESK